mmetsp:Transcript_77729/g.137654  ORF Transcript_77729/g.137654 Transcript_77729/m.137654 type:complete len:108 (+) Transcript_77729:81-404(+)
MASLAHSASFLQKRMTQDAKPDWSTLISIAMLIVFLVFVYDWVHFNIEAKEVESQVEYLQWEKKAWSRKVKAVEKQQIYIESKLSPERHLDEMKVLLLQDKLLDRLA